MNAWLIVIGVPVAAVALAGLGLHFVDTPWVRRTSTAAMSTQLAFAGAAWLLFATLPRESQPGGGIGDTCPSMDGAQGDLIAAIAFASIAVAAVALASGVIVVHRRAGTGLRILGGIGAAGIVVAIFLGIIATALCGMN